VAQEREAVRICSSFRPCSRNRPLRGSASSTSTTT
jgi:hypothetical protein